MNYSTHRLKIQLGCIISKKWYNKTAIIVFKTREIYKVCYSKGGIVMNEIDPKAQEELEKGYKKAEKVLSNSKKLDKVLVRTEKKLNLLPVVGTSLAMIPSMISLVRSYTKKEYTEIPIGTIIAIISALLYFISPVDLIPDVIPVAGHLDDAAVVGACLALVKSDLDDYKEWRENNKKDE